MKSINSIIGVLVIAGALIVSTINGRIEFNRAEKYRKMLNDSYIREEQITQAFNALESINEQNKAIIKESFDLIRKIQCNAETH